MAGRRPQVRIRPGLTIIELLTSMAILSILFALVVSAVGYCREAARCVECRANLRQLGIAASSYHDTYQGLPPGWQVDPTGRSGWGWAVGVLPWLEQRAVSERLSLSASIDSPVNEWGRQQAVPLLRCPSDPASSAFALYPEEEDDVLATHSVVGSETPLTWLPSANYVGIFGTTDPDEVHDGVGSGSFMLANSIRFAEFRRGLSQTMLIGERTSRKLSSSWMGFVRSGEDAPSRVVGYADRGPNSAEADECELDSRHSGFINVLWGDGRVAPVADKIDRYIYQQTAQRE